MSATARPTANALASKELALNGGPPVRTRAWLENFTMEEEEKHAACEVIDGGRLSLFEGSWTPEAPFSFWGGPWVQQLERDWAACYGVPHAVSMNSATSGLIAAVGALGLGYGDEVIVSPYTMTAAASCVLWYGAIPVFADVRLETGSLDPTSVEARITKRTRAMIIVHQFGIPAEMDSILALARRHELRVIEDCAQAHGARYLDRPVGTLGDIGVFSLNVNKTIQTGEGAVCLTRDARLRDRLALIRNHGEAAAEAAGCEDLTNLVGFNFRFTEVAAAMAIEQLKKLERLNAIRLEYVRALSDALARYEFLVPPPSCSHAAFGQACVGCRSTYYLYPMRFLPETIGLSRSEFTRALRAEGTPWIEGYTRPLYLQPLYQKRQAFKQGYPFAAPANADSRPNYQPGACPNAERLFAEQMLVNEYVRPPHTLDDIQDIARAIEKVAAR